MPASSDRGQPIGADPAPVSQRHPVVGQEHKAGRRHRRHTGSRWWLGEHRWATFRSDALGSLGVQWLTTTRLEREIPDRELTLVPAPPPQAAVPGSEDSLESSLAYTL